MKVLLISGDTYTSQEWNLDNILSTKSKKDIITQLIDDEWFDTTSTCGLTYGQIRDSNEFTLR
jgi:hypothetical protein